MTRGRPLDLCSADYVLDLFLPSFILRWFARASSSLSLSVLLHLLREANPLDSRSYIRALTGERIVRANRTSCARRRGHTPRSLFVIRPQQSAGSLSRLNVYVVREKKEQRMDRERERETVPGRARLRRCDYAWKVSSCKFDTRIRFVAEQGYHSLSLTAEITE